MRTLWFFVTTNINQRSGSISYILWCSTWFRCKCVSDHGLAAAVDLDQLRCAIVTDHLFFSVRECACVWVTAIQTLPRLTVVMLVFVYYFMHLSIWCQHSVDQLSMVSSKRPHIWKKYVFSLPFPLSLSIYLSVDGMTRLVWMLNNNCKSFVCSSHSPWNFKQFVFSVVHVEWFEIVRQQFLHCLIDYIWEKCYVMKKDKSWSIQLKLFESQNGINEEFVSHSKSIPKSISDDTWPISFINCCCISMPCHSSCDCYCWKRT